MGLHSGTLLTSYNVEHKLCIVQEMRLSKELSTSTYMYVPFDPVAMLYHYPWVSLLSLCSKRSDWPLESITTVVSSIPPMLVH